jgi:hypothetical protein
MLRLLLTPRVRSTFAGLLISFSSCDRREEESPTKLLVALGNEEEEESSTELLIARAGDPSRWS